MTTRPTPFDLVFADFADTRFPALERAILEAGHDPRDRNGFTLVREAVQLLHELRPDQGFGEGIDEFVGLVHGAFVFWLDGGAVVQIERETLDHILRAPPNGAVAPVAGSRSYYLQLPAQRVWGEPLEGSPPEPLDGGFVLVGPAELGLVAVFGIHSGRSGFTVVQARGGRPPGLVRTDGTPLFSSRLEGSAGAGLFSLAGAEELLELGYRCHALLGPSGAEPGLQQLAVA